MDKSRSANVFAISTVIQKLGFKEHKAEKDALWWITITAQFTVSVLCGEKNDLKKKKDQNKDWIERLKTVFFSFGTNFTQNNCWN